MKYCTNCGAELQNDPRFCISCGHPLEQDVSEKTVRLDKTPEVQQVSEQVRHVPRQPMSTKKKVALISIAAAAILLFGAHKIIENMYSPEKTVAAFEEAIKEQDIEKARNVMAFTDIHDQVEDRDIKDYLAFLKEKEDELIEELTESASTIDKDTDLNHIITDQNGNAIIKLTTGDKKLGLYQEYKIEAIPFDVKVSANLEDIDVEFRGDKRKVEDELILSNILPGTEHLKGVYNGAYATLTESATLDFANASENTLDIYFEFDGQYIRIDSNEPDSTLFVNGKSTGERVGDISQFGPAATDGSIVLHAEYHGENGIVKTNEVKVMNAEDVFLTFNDEDLYAQEEPDAIISYQPVEIDEPVESFEPIERSESIEEFMERYIYTSVEAMNAGDFSIAEPFHHPDGKSYAESKDYIDYIVSKGIKEDVIFVEVIDTDQIDEGYLVHTKEQYDIYYADGTMKRKTFYSSYKVYNAHGGGYLLWSLENLEEI